MPRVPARKNKHDYGLPLATIERRHVERSKRWHWGVPPTQVVRWSDPDYPEAMIEIGRFAEFKAIPVGLRGAKVFPIPKRFWFEEDHTALAGDEARTNPNPRRVGPMAHLTYDPDHASERIYVCLPDTLCADFAGLYRKNATVALSDLAKHVGGRHGKKRDYPEVQVTPLGTLTAVTYFTRKKGDENDGENRSLYEHQMGEDGGIPPMIAADARGRLWLAGGSYSCMIPGVAR
jgi:hypothetical protein